MKQIFKGMLIASDLDGTLIGKDSVIPQCNLDAIEYFKSNGGKFTIATGRAIESTRNYVKIIKPNAPCIVFNGAMIYDYDSEKVIWKKPISKNALKYTSLIMKKFPEIGVEVCTEGPINIIRNTPFIMKHVGIENISHCFKTLQEVKQEWYKVFFAMESDLIPKVQAYTNSLNHKDVWYVASSLNYFEMLPQGIDKGNAFIKLASYLNISRNKTFAIGDYYNDIELLNAASISATPENAPEDIKFISDMIVCNCNDGAIENLIKNIEKDLISY